MSASEHYSEDEFNVIVKDIHLDKYTIDARQGIAIALQSPSSSAR